ncbi:hypothetical protein [Emticicia sp. W12TSBA100-4]|uniref:hypothetical protein n=1 Tax=Emticicia sp. W12TSBA100-4 TaxID=3160965 RepID=UPI003305F244
MVIDNINEICIAIDIAILSISYPIIIDKISNIGDKYSSEYLSVIFNSEFPQSRVKINVFKKTFEVQFFKLALFATLFSFIFLIFKTEPNPDWENNWFISNSAKLIVITFTIILIVFFFIWLDKVALFNGKSKLLLTYIIKRYNNLKHENEIKNYHLKAINEITYYAIEKQDEHLQTTLVEFYLSVFSSIKMNHDISKPLEYPIDLYFLIYKIHEIVAKEEKKLKEIVYGAVSGNWLIGNGLQEIIISENTYGWLWRNIYTICDNPRLVKKFWGNTHQFFLIGLKQINIEYSFNNGQHQIINQAHVDKRNSQRNRFLEFHYALGGLLLYRGQYETLSYIFTYSQSSPPNYALLPDSMTDIFFWFEHFDNEFKHPTPIDLIYYFPELDNLGNRRQVNFWICSYITILFLRQYTLSQYYTYQDFKASPHLPTEISELYGWLNSISNFEKHLKNIFSNESLIKVLNFEELIKTKTDEFFEFILKLRESINGTIGQQKLSKSLSEIKVNSFYEESNAIITNAFEEFKPIFIEKDNEHLSGEFKLTVNGERFLMPKSAFIDNDMPFLNYESILANSIVSNKINRIIPSGLFITKTKSYLLNKENFLEAFSKIIKKETDAVIIGVGINFELKEIIKTSNYQNLIVYIPSIGYNSYDTFFVLRNKHLPAIEHLDLDASEIKKLQLVQLNEKLHLFGSVIDINRPENKLLNDEFSQKTESNIQELQVQIALAFKCVIHWKNVREIIQINIDSEFRELGIQNSINDVVPFTTERS